MHFNCRLRFLKGHSFSDFDVCPDNIQAELSGAILETFEWESRIYAKGSVLVNGRPYWTHKSSAIWWMNGSWRIGILTALGADQISQHRGWPSWYERYTGQYSIPAHSGICPTSQGTKWLYWDKKKTGEWLDTGDDITLTALGTIKRVAYM